MRAICNKPCFTYTDSRRKWEKDSNVIFQPNFICEWKYSLHEWIRLVKIFNFFNKKKNKFISNVFKIVTCVYVYLQNTDGVCMTVTKKENYVFLTTVNNWIDLSLPSHCTHTHTHICLFVKLFIDLIRHYGF